MSTVQSDPTGIAAYCTFSGWNHQTAAASHITVVQGDARAVWAKSNNAPIVRASERPDGHRLEACPAAHHWSGLQAHAILGLCCLRDTQCASCHEAGDLLGIAQHRHAAPGVDDHRSARHPAQVGNLLPHKCQRPIHEDCLLRKVERSWFSLDGVKTSSSN